jgi:MFS family permease
VLSLGFSLSSFIADPIRKKFGIKKTLFFSSCVQFVYLIFVVFPVYCIKKGTEIDFESNATSFGCYFSALILGMGSGPLWITAWSHIAELGDDTNKGMFNATFLCLFQLSLLVNHYLSNIIKDK